MAFYEHTIVGKQDLSDKEMQSLIDKYSKIFVKSGKILKTEKWGLLNLANKIKKNKKGNFVHFKIEIDGKLVKEIEKQLSIDTNVIRYLTVKYDKIDLKNEFFGSKK
ncbi:30S ribosomal protein S6 [Pelagibacteraceae bacterium]|nr:30S ribosomal protein S6 [Pelagibacteraceae bacterium]|tara:strand:- start:113 stop:433 length:321 start_codon:yes stop_codon:yes gene_type:complete